MAKYLLSRAVRDAGYKVVLTGEGSDEILAGYPHFRRDMLLYNSDGQDPAVIRTLLDSWSTATRCPAACCCPTARRAPLDGLRRVLGFVPSWLEAAARPDAQDPRPVGRRFPEPSSPQHEPYQGLPERPRRAAGSCSAGRR